MSSIREEKKKKTRKAIVAAAVRLFDQKGFDKTSIEELAREAGIGKGTIYTYFQNKTEIFYAFCEEQLEFVHNELARKNDPDAPILEQIMTIFMGEFLHLSQNKEFGRIFMQKMLFPDDGIKGDFEELDSRWLDLLFSINKRAQDRNELRKYSIVRGKPCSKATFGSQPSVSIAWVMSGWRWVGSSLGRSI